jgi:CrcB protein
VVPLWLTQSLFVGAGGFLGSVLRFTVGGVAHRLLPTTQLPVGTLAVNVAGCFVIGLLGGLGESRHVFGPQARLFLFIGVLGGFTTFSSFGYETLALARDADYLRAGANVILNLGAGLVAVWLGLALAKGW